MYNDVDEQPDEFLMDLIARYGQTIMNARNDLEKWVLWSNLSNAHRRFSLGLMSVVMGKGRIEPFYENIEYPVYASPYRNKFLSS